jgi:DNA-3-methyladenine glycosylase I
VEKMSDVTVGDDGLARCRWGASTDDYRSYHDLEWGRPVGDDAKVFEKLCLEGFQSGLSWLTILRKREGFRRAFVSFDPSALAKFGDGDIDRLLADPGIVRHRAKITAVITNARATMALREQGIPLAGLLWAHRPASTPAPKRLHDIGSLTPESTALSKELRRRGFAFVGPTTVYATMQSLGVVNDHLRDCHWRSIVEQEVAHFSVPSLRVT